jgi:spore germination cell wall hydrolase CwlJ-like protein
MSSRAHFLSGERIMLKQLILSTLTFCVLFTTTDPTNYKEDSILITSQIMAKEISCMAKNIYFEAGNESYEGKQAVSQVVINRVNDPRYPKDVCSVIYQRRGKLYQFSWVGQKKRYIADNESWYDCVDVATKTMNASISHEGLAKTNALFYHADYVRPKWKLRKLAQIGKHIFYTDDQA